MFKSIRLMKPSGHFLFFLVQLIVILSLSACSVQMNPSDPEAIRSPAFPQSANAYIGISHQFQTPQRHFDLSGDELPIPLLDWMRNHLAIETAYGGSFINAIDGVRSGYTGQDWLSQKKEDWFLYVNGSLSDKGAAEVQIQPGDQIIWDFHSWNDGSGDEYRHIVGAFPQPFSGTDSSESIYLFHPPGYEAEAKQVKEWLSQYTNAKLLITVDQQDTIKNHFSGDSKSPVIWIGTFDSIPEPWLALWPHDLQHTNLLIHAISDPSDLQKRPLWLFAAFDRVQLSNGILTLTKSGQNLFRHRSFLSLHGEGGIKP